MLHTSAVHLQLGQMKSAASTLSNASQSGATQLPELLLVAHPCLLLPGQWCSGWVPLMQCAPWMLLAGADTSAKHLHSYGSGRNATCTSEGGLLNSMRHTNRQPNCCCRSCWMPPIPSWQTWTGGSTENLQDRRVMTCGGSSPQSQQPRRRSCPCRLPARTLQLLWARGTPKRRRRARWRPKLSRSRGRPPSASQVGPSLQSSGGVLVEASLPLLAFGAFQIGRQCLTFFLHSTKGPTSACQLPLLGTIQLSLNVCAQVPPEGGEAPETTAEPAAKLDPDSDEIREKFRIVRVRMLVKIGSEPRCAGSQSYKKHLRFTHAVQCAMPGWHLVVSACTPLHMWRCAVCCWHSFSCIGNALRVHCQVLMSISERSYYVLQGP